MIHWREKSMTSRCFARERAVVEFWTALKRQLVMRLFGGRDVFGTEEVVDVL